MTALGRKMLADLLSRHDLAIRTPQVRLEAPSSRWLQLGLRTSRVAAILRLYEVRVGPMHGR